MEHRLLEIHDLVKYFPTNAGVVHAVDHVDLAVDAGKRSASLVSRAAESRRLDAAFSI